MWLIAFTISVLLTLVLTPLSRRLALAINLVDRPGQHKSHIRPTPYLGGVALIVSVLVALGMDARANPRVAAVALGGAIIGALGLLDDDRTIDPRWRFATELAVAAVVTSLGLRIHASGIVSGDVALTLLWLVGVTNAFNLLDNMDGLAAGVAAAASAGIFALAIMGGQPVVATVAASVVGACLAFLVYNRPPASIFMGDAGSLFLGFLLAVLTISVNPALEPPFSFTVPLILLALPVLDTSTVTVSRLRRGLKVSLGGKDHLSHRLVALGLSRGKAVATLVGVEAALAVLAILAGRRVLQLRWTALIAAVLLCAVAAVTARAQVYVQPTVGFPRRLRLAAAATAAATLVVAAPAMLALVRAYSDMRAAVRTAEVALDALSQPDAARAATDFERAAESFTTAGRALRGPWTSLGLAVPGLSSNLHASRVLAAVGEQAAAAGAVTAGIAHGETVGVSAGSVSTPDVARLSVTLSQASETLDSAHERLAKIERPFLLPSLQRAVRETDRRLAHTSMRLRDASTIAGMMPNILGAEGIRRYFVVFQNDQQLRGTGGVIDGWAELVTEGGRLRVERGGGRRELEKMVTSSATAASATTATDRPEASDPSRRWTDVNLSPDFPTTARRIADLYTRSGGSPLNGVLAVDSVGLASLLHLTGPVRVDGWPEPVGSLNVADVVRGKLGTPSADDGGGSDFIGRLLTRVVQASTSAELGSAADIIQRLRPAAQENHLLLYLSRPEEQQSVEAAGIDGSVEPVRGDSVMVVTRNAPGEAAEGGRRRSVRYDVLLRPGRPTAELSGRLEVGVVDERSGERHELPTHISIYSPFDAVSASLGSRSVAVRSREELGRKEHSLVLGPEPRDADALTMEIRGRLALTGDGWYRLDVLPQPSVGQDVEVSLVLPQGWRIADSQGFRRVDGRHATTTLGGATDAPLLVRVERTTMARVWERLTRA